MAFKIRWDRKARDFLRKQDKAISSRIVKKVNEIKDEPMRYLDPLISIKSYKLRAGDYRAIIDVDWKNKILLILLIDHRKRIYKSIK